MAPSTCGLTQTQLRWVSSLVGGSSCWRLNSRQPGSLDSGILRQHWNYLALRSWIMGIGPWPSARSIFKHLWPACWFGLGRLGLHLCIISHYRSSFLQFDAQVSSLDLVLRLCYIQPHASGRQSGCWLPCQHGARHPTGIPPPSYSSERTSPHPPRGWNGDPVPPFLISCFLMYQKKNWCINEMVSCELIIDSQYDVCEIMAQSIKLRAHFDLMN